MINMETCECRLHHIQQLFEVNLKGRAGHWNPPVSVVQLSMLLNLPDLRLLDHLRCLVWIICWGFVVQCFHPLKRDKHH